MILATLLLLSGLSISVVAIYYSVMGLMAIFSAAAIPIAIMGVTLEIGKLVTASWVKAHWPRLPALMKWYAVTAVAILMVITSLGIFGFLSKAHSDQTLVSGDVQSKIAIYDEKIKTARENIEADRKQLKQMDEAVDQTMGRSTSEEGATKANNIRRSQQRDRSALARDIETQQKIITQLNDESAPIRAENRKVEAEVGPIKYIAKFVYGEHGADENMLERAVTWVIILIVIVFDPLAVIMLLAAQMTYTWAKEKEESEEHGDWYTPNSYVADVGEKPTIDELIEIEKQQEIMPITPFDAVPSAEDKTLIADNAERVQELQTRLAEANADIDELAKYAEFLQQDYRSVSNLHQQAITREADLINEFDELRQELVSLKDDLAAMSIAPPPEVITRPLTEQEISLLDAYDGEQSSDEQAIEPEVSTQQTEPLIKPLEGEAAYNLLKEVGIFTEDGKLKPEYGGEEDTESLEEHTPVEVNKYTQAEETEPHALEAVDDTEGEPKILSTGIDVAERPGDYITDPVANLFTKREPKTGFGNNFPDEPTRGDLFLRTDFRPTRLFKWNDQKWIEVNKSTTSAYIYNDAYIQFLADQVLTGVYSIDELSETEQEQVQTLIGGRRG